MHLYGIKYLAAVRPSDSDSSKEADAEMAALGAVIRTAIDGQTGIMEEGSNYGLLCQTRIINHSSFIKPPEKEGSVFPHPLMVQMIM